MSQTHAWTLPDWRKAYEQGAQPEVLLTNVLRAMSADDPALISVLDEVGLQAALDELATLLDSVDGKRDRLPLYGIPFVVKDNIDAVGFETTAACPDFAYRPNKDATAVQLLKSAGAVLVGKANLDQFATGLVGTRSPYGSVPNAFDPSYVSGGSSSGSASLVARGLVPFSLGTDTAGSGRVPAALNNIIGLKATCGSLSIRGVVPACRSLDCVSIFALTLADADDVFQIAAQYDAEDPFSRPQPAAMSTDLGSRPRLAVPANPPWFGEERNADAWHQVLAQWERLPVDLVPVDFSPLWELAELLYEGPWIAERHAAVQDFMADKPDAMNSVVREIINQAHHFTATDYFQAYYRAAELRREIETLMQGIDALLVPSAPTFPTQQAVAEEPIKRNSELGVYTNFVNLSDMCALAVPAGFRTDGLPFGITLIGRTWQDRALQSLAGKWLATLPRKLGATGTSLSATELPGKTLAEPPAGYIRVAVVGAHLTGMPLNGQLTERGAVLVEETKTDTCYRLHALANTTPPKPGLQRVGSGEGQAIIVELWDMPASQFGSFVALIPAPLGIGTLTLANGESVKGFICEGHGIDDAKDITAFGGWRAYVASQANATGA